jgi:predicted acetyltransferase
MVDALKRGWSPDNLRPESGAEALARIAEDPAGYLAAQDDPEARAGDITLPDGSKVERLPGLHRFIWDGDFCGIVGLRWARGGAELPPHVPGHIGYAVVPWKRRRGYATRALALMLPLARDRGLAFVDLTTDEGNVASRRTILANGGRLIGQFNKPAALGGTPSLKYRIALDTGPL